MFLPFVRNYRMRRGVLGTWMSPNVDIPVHIEANLEKARKRGGPFGLRGSGLGWEEVIYTPTVDGTAITAAAETILLPDFSIPGSYLSAGKILKYTLMGRQSTVITTPGTIIHRLRWGGVAGVVVVLSGTFAPDPTAAASNLTWMAEYWVQCRAAGVSGNAMGFGRIEWSDYDDATVATIVGNLNMRMAPVSAPTVATIDTTIDKLLSVTYTSSVATASCQAHCGILEALN